MDRQAEAKQRYERLKQTLADDGKIRKKASRARVIGLVVIGGWVIAPVAAWRVDLESVLRPEFFRTPTPHEAHLLSLPRGSSEDAAPARAWEAASLAAIDAPLFGGTAYREIGIFPEESPQALGLRVSIPEGQRLHLSVEEDGDDLPRLFLDVFKEAPENLTARGPDDPVADTPNRRRRPALVLGGELDGDRWFFDAPETGDYVLRLQPELGEGGRYHLTVRVGAPWHFPVAGGGEEDIGSVFGDPR
ncbi:MAG: hypothetical protein PVJ76_16615, partial [Gemmatimonadota bacterium]